MARKKQQAADGAEPVVEKKAKKRKGGLGKKLKKAGAGLLVVGVVGGGGFFALQSHNTQQAEALAAVPYATGTELAERAYQAFRAKGTRYYELDCPTVQEKTLGEVTSCSAEDEQGNAIGITATTVEDPVKRFEFQQA
jgi:predicted Fe-Mo cluster-binding NifX family protein